MAALPIPMPLRREEVAPTFDTSRPRELPRYFEDLERLMDRAQITDEADKKKEAVYYVNFDTEQLWKAIPEFEDPNISYEEFKKAILVYYPDASGYSLRDLDLLISEHQHLGIASAKNLSDYHLRFMAITSWLIKKQHLSDLEQRRAYIRVFRPQLLSVITNQLQLKNPDHHPDIPYRVPEVYATAQFILQENSTLGLTSTATSIAPTDNILTIENLAPFMADVTKAIVDALQGPSTTYRSGRFHENKRRHRQKSQCPNQATVTTPLTSANSTPELAAESCPPPLSPSYPHSAQPDCPDCSSAHSS